MIYIRFKFQGLCLKKKKEKGTEEEKREENKSRVLIWTIVYFIGLGKKQGSRYCSAFYFQHCFVRITPHSSVCFVVGCYLQGY